MEHYKEVCAYLPYETRFEHPVLIWGGNPPEPSHEEIGESTLTHDNIEQMLKGGRLLLRPLSMIKKDIFIKGMGFVLAYDWLELEKYVSIDTYSGTKHWIDGLPYSIVTQLIEMKFDVFGLIDKGIATELKEV